MRPRLKCLSLGRPERCWRALPFCATFHSAANGRVKSLLPFIYGPWQGTGGHVISRLNLIRNAGKTAAQQLPALLEMHTAFVAGFKMLLKKRSLLGRQLSSQVVQVNFFLEVLWTHPIIS